MLKHLNIRKELFWDVDPNRLDEQKNKRLIIERIANRGNSAELKELFSYFGYPTVQKTLTGLNYLDPKTLNFFALILGIPKTKFKCYTRKQSTRQHWTS